MSFYIRISLPNRSRTLCGRLLSSRLSPFLSNSGLQCLDTPRLLPSSLHSWCVSTVKPVTAYVSRHKLHYSCLACLSTAAYTNPHKATPLRVCGRTVSPQTTRTRSCSCGIAKLPTSCGWGSSAAAQSTTRFVSRLPLAGFAYLFPLSHFLRPLVLLISLPPT